MRKTNLIVIAIFGSFAFASCGEEQKKEEDRALPVQNEMHAPVETGESDLDDGAVEAAPEFENEAIGLAYDNYLEVKRALVNSNASEAQEAAGELAENIQDFEGGSQAFEAATEISNSAELNAQRTAFLDLSSGMEDIVTGALTSGEIFKQYCPMAFEGEGGYWLSSSEEVRNPYYGDKMLKCGSVTETIQ